jgi:uncharacterized protein YqhQ
VDDGRVLAILAAADASAVLPRLGGMARPEGVFIAGEARWAFARVDGGMAEGPTARLWSPLRHVPIVRGLLRLVTALAPIFARRPGRGGRERSVFAAALGLPLAFVFLPALIANIVGLVTTVAFVIWLFRGRTLYLHGAEHRAISAAETRALRSTWEGTARPSRYALRCGTNFAVLALPLVFALDHWWPFAATPYTPIVLTCLSLGFAMEVWQAVHAAPRGLARIVLAPGLALQRLTTREPTLEETRTALRAVATVLADAAGVAMRSGRAAQSPSAAAGPALALPAAR